MWSGMDPRRRACHASPSRCGSVPVVPGLRDPAAGAGAEKCLQQPVARPRMAGKVPETWAAESPLQEVLAR